MAKFLCLVFFAAIASQAHGFHFNAVENIITGSFSESSEETPEFTCIKDGLYPNPNSCSSYLQCSGGLPSFQDCPAGHHYNKESEICGHPCEAKCESAIACDCGWSSCYKESSFVNVCRLPVAPGPCDAELDRYYFDYLRGKCMKFGYGGCGGNENRFRTYTACEQRCHRHSHLSAGSRQVFSEPDFQFTCPIPIGQFPHPYDCSKFIICMNFFPSIYRCIRGLYDSWLDQCIGDWNVRCAYKCPDTEGRYPIPGYCESYVRCMNDKSFLFQCPQSKVFDLRRRECVPEEESDCRY